MDYDQDAEEEGEERIQLRLLFLLALCGSVVE